MADIYLMGHGSWATVGAREPFVTMPSNTSLVLYTPIGRFISSHQTVEIMRGAANALKVDREIGPFKQAPNLRLSDGLFDEEVRALLHTGKRFVRVDRRTYLSEMIEKYAGNRIHWLACVPRLRNQDTTQGGFNDDYFPDRGVGV